MGLLEFLRNRGNVILYQVKLADLQAEINTHSDFQDEKLRVEYILCGEA